MVTVAGCSRSIDLFFFHTFFLSLEITLFCECFSYCSLRGQEWERLSYFQEEGELSYSSKGGCLIWEERMRCGDSQLQLLNKVHPMRAKKRRGSYGLEKEKRRPRRQEKGLSTTDVGTPSTLFHLAVSMIPVSCSGGRTATTLPKHSYLLFLLQLLTMMPR